MPSLYRNSPNVNQDFVSLKENKKKRVKSYQDFTKIRIYIRILLQLASNAFAIMSSFWTFQELPGEPLVGRVKLWSFGWNFSLYKT
jgi:hypothetical protein